MTIGLPIIASLMLSLIILILGIVTWLLLGKAVGRAITIMGTGLLITFMLYFVFTTMGIYGKTGAKAGYILNVLGLIVMLLGASTAIYQIKRARTSEAKTPLR